MAEPVGHGHDAATTVNTTLPPWVLLIPFLPMLGVALCTICAIARVKSKAPAFLTVLCLAGSFVAALAMFAQIAPEAMGLAQGEPHGRTAVVHAWDWISFQYGATPAQSVIAGFSFYVDSLTCLWMLFVTGLGALIALYASEYMSHDLGVSYSRFFVAFNLFVFSMACLVMGDNLALLFLGWEGVGLCSYLLIGYFYKKPSAVAAAKKAFIMNRIGDLGLSLGVMLTFVQFGTLEYARLFALPEIHQYLEFARAGEWGRIPFLVQLIPVLLTVGAFGKSAQLPLYVWLPDAMEGPTPVSALIHAATMVTAGVYLVARFFPFYQCSEYALPIVAWVGTLTALLAATIGMAQFDIKRIMAYSTVSQLGYMFAGLGVMTSVGAAWHVFTHAFFKALLFLCCGAVMHGFAGQLDLRKLSGVWKVKGWGVVGFGMLVGCLNLAGFPFTAGFFSKDTIIGRAFESPGGTPIGVILLLTAGLTAYYTFRVFFRVFVGPVYFEPGDELHSDADHAHGDDHGHAGGQGGDHGHAHTPAAGAAHGHGEFHPHAPGWAINTVLGLLAVLALVAAVTEPTHFVEKLVNASTAAMPTEGGVAEAGGHEAAQAVGHAESSHLTMLVVSGVVGFVGISIAFLLHYVGRTTAARSKADALLPVFGPIAIAAQHKWYVDELYDFIIVRPLWVLSHVLFLIDKLVVDGTVNLVGFLPRLAGYAARKQQTGVMHDYAVRMAAGVCLVVLIALAIWAGGDWR